MKTHFVTQKLDIEPGVHLWMDGNSKVCLDRPFDAPHANCFSLVSIDDCPGSTPACESCCYTKGLAKYSPETFERYRHNSKVIRTILQPADDYGRLYWRTVVVMARHIRDNCATGFRWHVSGDIFSEDYARFIADVCKNARTPCWLYTRSFDLINPLIGVRNLVVNLSADRDNLERARSVQEGTGFRICYMSLEGEVPALEPESVIFPNYPLRGRDLDDPTEAPWWGEISQAEKRMVCPPDFFGQSEQLRCGPCRKCLDHPQELVQLG